VCPKTFINFLLKIEISHKILPFQKTALFFDHSAKEKKDC